MGFDSMLFCVPIAKVIKRVFGRKFKDGRHLCFLINVLLLSWVKLDYFRFRFLIDSDFCYISLKLQQDIFHHEKNLSHHIKFTHKIPNINILQQSESITQQTSVFPAGLSHAWHDVTSRDMTAAVTRGVCHPWYSEEC